MTLLDHVRVQLAYRDSAVNNKFMCAKHSTPTPPPPPGPPITSQQTEHGTQLTDSTIAPWESQNTSGLYWRLFHRFQGLLKSAAKGGCLEVTSTALLQWQQHGWGGLCWSITCCLDLLSRSAARLEGFSTKALLPSCRAEIPSNPHLLLLQGCLTHWDKGLQSRRREWERKREERGKTRERRGDETRNFI